MVDLSTNTWVVILAVVLLALLIAVWMLRRPRERIRVETPDVLTPGAAPAQRNTLLTEAPPAVAAVTPPAGEIIGVVSAPLSSTAPAAETTKTVPGGPQAEGGEGDDLTRIKGVGPKLSATLKGLGVTRYAQIAGWTDADVAEIDSKLGAFQGRIARDNWIEQCRYLAAGDTAGFEGRFGKL